MLPGDQDGYWGPITGFDFCERNYVTSQYVGEMGCMMTNFISLPVYLIIAAYVYANGAKLAPLTYVYLVFAFFDMFSAGMSHGTLLMPWTHAQEWVLGGCYLFFFIVMCIRYNESRLCKVIILIMSGSRVVDGAIEVFMEGFDSKFTGASPIVDFLGRAVPIISIVGMVGLFIFGRDFVARLLACETLIIVPAFYIFGITEVNAKKLLRPTDLAPRSWASSRRLIRLLRCSCGSWPRSLCEGANEDWPEVLLPAGTFPQVSLGCT
jgi:hypothetical protein